MRITVTGGSGFIGANLCSLLVQRGHRVLVLDDLSTSSASNLEGIDVTLLVASVLDLDVVHDAVADADAVVHLAARGSVPRSVADPIGCHAANTTGTMHVLEAARASGAHVVAASSSSVYGGGPELPKHEAMPTRARSPYAASKVALEALIQGYQGSFELDALAFRFFNVYGPLQAAGHAYAAVIPTWIDAALRGRPLPIHSDGRQTRDFTYVSTVCEVLVDAVERRVTHDRPVNLALGNRVSLRELAALIEASLGQPVEREHLPARAGDVTDSQADPTTLRHLFPEVRPVAVATGIGSTIDWFRHQQVGATS